MMCRRFMSVVIGATMAAVSLPTSLSRAVDKDGADLPTEYAGFSAAVQNNKTGFGNAGTSTSNNEITVGAELDALYVSADSSDLYIGITGNLPNKLADSHSIIVLIQTTASPPGNLSNVLNVNNLEGIGGGRDALARLHTMVCDAAFVPDKAIVFNRVGSSDGANNTNYMDAWNLADGSKYFYNANHSSATPGSGCVSSCPLLTDPGPECIMSGWIDATNTAGVTDVEADDGATQEANAATAVKGCRIRLSRNCFGINDPIIKIMVVLATPGAVSNQFLPPLADGFDPTGTSCYPFGEVALPDLDAMPGLQHAEVNLANAPFDTAPNFAAGNGTGTDNIPLQWGATLVATQRLHTCFGNAVAGGTLTLTTGGSELNQLFIRNADVSPSGDYLHIAVTGNFEKNGNKVFILIDSKAGGQNTITATAGYMAGWAGRKMDVGFEPDFAYVVNNSGNTLFADGIDLVADASTFLGASAVPSVGGEMSGGTNPNNNLFVLDNSNAAGVNGTPAATLGDPLSATTGFEAYISMTELGVDLSTGACPEIKVMVMLAGGDGGYLSNQCLPGLNLGGVVAPNVPNLEADNTPDPDFDFSDDAVENGAFLGIQYASYTARRLGDLTGDCCINSADATKLVEVLLGTETDLQIKYRADLNRDGKNDGHDVKPFVDRLIATNPCS